MLYMGVATVEITGLNTYEQLAKNLVGRWFERLTAALVVLFCWGTNVVYVVVMGDILDPIRSIHGFPEVFQGEWGLRLLTVIYWGFFMLPLSLAKEINTLRYASFFGLASTVVLVIAVVVHATKDSETSMSELPPIEANVNMVLALPVIVFSYSCQTNAFEIYAELKGRSVSKMTLIASVSMALCTALYIIIAIAGAMEFGANTNANILSNYSNPTGTPYIAFAYFCMSVNLTMSFPVCLFPSRDAVLQMLGYQNVYKTPTSVRMPVAGALATTAVIAGLFVPGISILFGLLGGVCGSTLAFIWPALFALRTRRWTVEAVGLAEVTGTWILLVTGILAGVLGTAVSIYQQF
eukprot:GDKK01037106.1.p1 GENE.GDKK01037106.1~~GDKK01037106.1.p1  ORF type:complete len:351 (+),score=33.76 GDKK01037106.1:1-1053(+)